MRLRGLSGDKFSQIYYQGLRELWEQELEVLHERADLVGNEQRKQDMLTQLAVLNGFCQQSQPFASPFYWAGFICQGM
jgi:CHAT domain-containing protein